MLGLGWGMSSVSPEFTELRGQLPWAIWGGWRSTHSQNCFLSSLVVTQRKLESHWPAHSSGNL